MGDMLTEKFLYNEHYTMKTKLRTPRLHTNAPGRRATTRSSAGARQVPSTATEGRTFQSQSTFATTLPMASQPENARNTTGHLNTRQYWFGKNVQALKLHCFESL